MSPKKCRKRKRSVLFLPDDAIWCNTSPAQKRLIWKTLLSVLNWDGSIALKLLILGYVIKLEPVNNMGCVVCIENWQSAAKICNECGAAEVWRQRKCIWSEYNQQTDVKKWQWPELVYLSDLDVRCGAMHAFLMKKNRFLNAKECVDIYRQLVLCMPNTCQQIVGSKINGFKNIIQILLCCFHPEIPNETVNIFSIINKERERYGCIPGGPCTIDCLAVQLHKDVEVASRLTSRQPHFDPVAFRQFLFNGPRRKNIALC